MDGRPPVHPNATLPPLEARRAAVGSPAAAADASAAPLEGRRVELPGGPAGCFDVGEGPAIVCVHGLPGTGRDFRWLAEPLAGRARLVAVDLPGFGQTPVSTAPDPSPEGRAAFVVSLIDALGLDRPVVVGHSMGGLAAVGAVSLRPDDFAGLALLASPGVRPHATYRRLPRRAMVAATSGPWAPLLTPVVRRLFVAAGFRGYSDAALLRTIVCLRHTSLAAHAARVHALRLPTMTAWCRDDALIEPAVLEELDAVVPDGPRLVWPTGGHVPQKTHAAEVADALASMAALSRARQPWLAGPTVRLRPLRSDDFDALYAVASDPVLWEQHPCPDRWQEPVFRAFFGEALDHGGALAVLDAASGRVIGSSQYRWLDESAGVLEIGWTFLARDRWGGATNAELKRLMVDHALRFATRVVFFVGPANLRSQRALEKIGAVRLGDSKNSAGHDRVRYELTAATWQGR